MSRCEVATNEAGAMKLGKDPKSTWERYTKRVRKVKKTKEEKLWVAHTGKKLTREKKWDRVEVLWRQRTFYKRVMQWVKKVRWLSRLLFFTLPLYSSILIRRPLQPSRSDSALRGTYSGVESLRWQKYKTDHIYIRHLSHPKSTQSERISPHKWSLNMIII